MNNRKNKIINSIILSKGGLILIDSVSISLAWLVAYELRQQLINLFGYPLNPRINYIKVLPLIILAWLFANSLYGLYHKKRQINLLFIFQAVLKSTLLGGLITMSIGYWFREFSLGRSFMLIFLLLSLFLLLISRTTYVKINENFIKRGYGLLKTLIIGTGETAIRALQKISEHPEYGYDVIGFINNDEEKIGTTICNIPVIGTIKDLNKIIKEKQIDKIIFAEPSLSKDMIFQIISETDDNSIIYMVVSNVFPVMSENMIFEDVGGIPTFILKSQNSRFLYDIFKRVFDFTFSIIFLILFLPFFPFIMLAIKLESKGPIFFKQKRVGYKGEIFEIYKFRTMYVDTDAYQRAPQSAYDPRITKVGRVLRRFSFDEVPQFYNVLKGDMSIIGPRPEMPFIAEKYKSWQKKRLEVKPGITGLWQVLGRKDLPLEDNLEYDFYYIKNRSFSLDVAILFRTIYQVLKQKGAY